MFLWEIFPLNPVFFLKTSLILFSGNFEIGSHSFYHLLCLCSQKRLSWHCFSARSQWGPAVQGTCEHIGSLGAPYWPIHCSAVRCTSHHPLSSSTTGSSYQLQQVANNSNKPRQELLLTKDPHLHICMPPRSVFS